MIEGDREIDPAEASDNRYGETLLYDLAKFLTSLSLLAIGGVLTIADSSHGPPVKPGGLIMVTCVLFLALVLSASTASTIAIYRYSDRPMKPRLHYYLLATVGLLGMGLGMFTFMWIHKIT
jgi:hypothetical protein